MRVKMNGVVLSLVWVAFAMPLVAPTDATASKPGARAEVFSALAQPPGGGSPVNVKIYINSYSTVQEGERLHKLLLDGGPSALLKALGKMKSKGHIERDGSVGLYNFKFILSKPIAGGRHIYAVADRPIGFLEAYFSTRSKDYPFGILELDLKEGSSERDKGEGTLIYAAKIKVLNGDKVEIENVTFAPIKLLAVRQF